MLPNLDNLGSPDASPLSPWARARQDPRAAREEALRMASAQARKAVGSLTLLGPCAWIDGGAEFVLTDEIPREIEVRTGPTGFGVTTNRRYLGNLNEGEFRILTKAGSGSILSEEDLSEVARVLQRLEIRLSPGPG